LTNEKFFPLAHSQSQSAATRGRRGAFSANARADQRAAFGGGTNFVLGGLLRRSQYGVKPEA
jgi:hypothetical protein